MQLYDPTVPGPERDNRRAAALAGLDGRTIGLLENGKLNAVSMLRETAAVFEAGTAASGADLLEVQRQRARAGRDAEGGGAEGRFPDNRARRLRLLFDVQFA